MRIIDRRREPLFSEHPLAGLLHMQGLKIEQHVADVGADEILVTPIEDLVDVIHEEFFIQPLTLYRDQGHSSEPIESNH
jgi:hypothetical protein